MSLQELQETFPATIRIVDVKVRNRGEAKKMGAGEAALRVGDRVMLEINRDLTYGVVCKEPYTLPFIPPMRIMTSILRPATEAEAAVIARHERMAQDGMAYCRERAESLGLQLKMVEVYGSFRKRETTFIYTSEDRIDFRQLVKDLARRFGGRIEMRHIGTREEAKRMGGVDSCGLTLCCTAFMTDFKPVSVKKARHFDMPASETRLIGICGRLKCCLMFEEMEAKAAGGTPPAPSLINPTRQTAPSSKQ